MLYLALAAGDGGRTSRGSQSAASAGSARMAAMGTWKVATTCASVASGGTSASSVTAWRRSLSNPSAATTISALRTSPLSSVTLPLGGVHVDHARREAQLCA